MTVKLTWNCAATMTAVYAASQLAARDKLADARLQAAIAEVVQSIVQRLQLEELDAKRFWQTLWIQARGAGVSEAVIGASLREAGYPELMIDTTASIIGGRLAEVRLAVQELYPRLDEQLPLRARPLQEMWTGYGNGLMRLVGQRSHPDLLPKKVTMVVLHPAVGGAGQAVLSDLSEGWGWIEAVLANPDPRLPEILRLAWIVTTLGLGHRGANRLIDVQRLPRVATIAAVPIVLASAESLELIRDANESIEAALDLWGVEVNAAIVRRWWQQQCSGTVPFAVGIKALDRMLEE